MITTNMKTINTLIKTIIIKFINVKFILVIIKFSFKVIELTWFSYF